MGAHLLQRLQEPGPERVHHHPLDDDVRPRNDQGRDEGERRRRRVARNHHSRWTQFRPADECDPSPALLRRDSDLRAEIGKHFLGVVARGLAFNHGRRARRIEACEQDGRFDLGRGDGGAIFDRRGIAGALEDDRTAPAFSLRENLRAHEPQRVEDAPHRPLAQRSVAVEGCGDPMTADDPHHQAAARAGVAEIERFARG